MPAENADDILLLFADSDLVVACKPAGVPTQPDKSGSADLLSLLGRQLKLPPGSLLPVHRLDRPVAGLVVVARKASAQTALTRQMGERQMGKSYLAVVCAHPDPAEGCLTDYLIKNERLNVSRVVGSDNKQAKKAILYYQTIESTVVEGQPLALLKIDLETGRHHQIRAQLSHAGWPLWGDTKYNPALHHVGGWHQLALIAAGLTFLHPATGQSVKFSLPLPEHKPFIYFNTNITIV